MAAEFTRIKGQRSFLDVTDNMEALAGDLSRAVEAEGGYWSAVCGGERRGLGWVPATGWGAGMDMWTWCSWMRICAESMAAESVVARWTAAL